MEKESNQKGVSLMSGILIGIVVIVVLLCGLVCAVLIGPELFTPWQENTHYPSPDLPWNGPDSKPIEQYRQTPSLGSTTGYNSQHRWYTSAQHKPSGNYYGRIIDKYVREFDGFEEWQGAGTVWDGEEIQIRRAPYKFTFMSIQPVIVFMIPQDPNTVISVREEGRFVGSRFLENQYYYATSLPHHPDMQWFAPELNRGPEPLNLAPGETKVIEWSEGRLILTEEEGQVISRRE